MGKKLRKCLVFWLLLSHGLDSLGTHALVSTVLWHVPKPWPGRTLWHSFIECNPLMLKPPLLFPKQWRFWGIATNSIRVWYWPSPVLPEQRLMWPDSQGFTLTREKISYRGIPNIRISYTLFEKNWNKTLLKNKTKKTSWKHDTVSTSISLSLPPLFYSNPWWD